MVKDRASKFQWPMTRPVDSEHRATDGAGAGAAMAAQHPPCSLLPRIVRLTPEQLQRCMPDPPLCFCNKPAHRSVSSLGIMYDCHKYADTAAQKICGFHAHGRAWDTFRQDECIDPDDPELSVCPYFNFTFCVAFGMVNDFAKATPTGPRCFCGLPVAMAEQRQRIVFKCPNYDIDGAKPKCAWNLRAEEVAFGRPHPQLHDFDSFRND